MRWNWQQSDWPRFRWNPNLLTQAEAMFLRGSGVLIGAAKHLDREAQEHLLVETMSGEALTSSEIEGEFLNRVSVQSSIQKQLGLASDRQKVRPAERGIAELMVSTYRSMDSPLTETDLFAWHRMIVSGRTDLRDVGRYRTSSEPMQVVSGTMSSPKVHFEAPPAARLAGEMDRFIAWFNSTAPGSEAQLPALTRAGIAHLYFESIHPFEDGNGRVGRAISEKALVQGFGQTIIIALARSILAHHKGYYAALEAANKKNELNDWLRWFAAVAIEAQHCTLTQIEFIIEKTRLLAAVKGKINARQQKVLLRMLQEGPDGFKGGMTANKYSLIAGTPPATTTRDLAGLVEIGALTRVGTLKHTRYSLNIPVTSISTFSIDQNGEVQKNL